MEFNRKVSEILESINDAFYAVDADWRLTYINRRCEQWWRRSGEELLGKVLWDMFPDYETTQGYREHVQAMEERLPVRFETYSPNLHAWAEVNIYPAGDGGLSVYIRNISERKHLEGELTQYRDNFGLLSDAQMEELRRSERHFRTLVENLPVTISRIDRQGRFLFRSPQWDVNFRLDSSAMIGKTWQELGIPEEGYRPWVEKYAEVFLTGRAAEFETSYRNKEGKVWDYLVRLIPETDEDGRIESLLAVALDISERKQASEALRRSEERFRKIFHACPAMMAILRMADDKYLEVNQTFLEGLGFSREEVLGRSPLELNIWPQGKNRLEPMIAELQQKGELLSVEFDILTKAGKRVTVLFTSRIVDFNGEPCRIGSMIDITREKQLEAELLRLDRLNTVGEMAAAIGHEVRNPLTTVRGYLQMFQRKAESEAYREQFATMIEELDRANVIISDFLSLAKNKAVELKSYNLNDIVSALLPLLQAEALRIGHELAIDMNDVPDFAMDEKEIRQLMLNLARNALEAMEPGGWLTIATHAEGGKVVLRVSDTGPGIPQSVLAKLGTPFMTTKEKGTGLGLAVCYRIAERHGAKIKVETSPQGTTFRVIFRAEQEG